MLVTLDYKRQPKIKYRYGGSSIRATSQYRYGGNGILHTLLGSSNSGRLLANSLKNIINRTSKSNLVQKAVNAIQEGSLKAVSSQTQKAIENKLATVAKNRKANKKQKEIINNLSANLASTSIPSVSSIADIVKPKEGRGIVYD